MRRAAQENIIGEGKFPDRFLRNGTDNVISVVNWQHYRSGQGVKSIMKKLVGLAMDVLGIQLFGTKFMIEVSLGGMRVIMQR